MKVKTAARVLCAALFFGALTALALSARAMSSTEQVAWKGKSVSEVSGWPEGTLALVNDWLRTDGWNPWFSECANDVNYYEYKIRNTGDVNRLLQSLAAIKATNVTLSLNPGKQSPAIGFGAATSNKNQTALVFFVGNQKQLDEWYGRLPEVEPGVRKFGVNQYKQVPLASPPTLMLYAGHEAIDLKQLKVPDAVTVVSYSQAAEKGSEETVKAIEVFIANRKSGVSKPATRAN